MRIEYLGPDSNDKLWHNDSPPAINETNLNRIEGEIKALINEVNEYVVPNETELTTLKSGGKLLTQEQADLLTNFDDEPKGTSEKLVKSGGIAKYVSTKTSNLETQISSVQTDITSIKNVLPKDESGKVLSLATVAKTGDYNDLSNKLRAGTNITIKDGVISAAGGGGDVPVGLAAVAYSGSFYDLLDYPDPEEYEIVASKVTAITKNSTDEEYPSAKAVYTLVGDIEAALAKL